MTTTNLRPYRRIEHMTGACPVCDDVHGLTDRHDQPSFINKYGVRQKAFLLVKHGPRDDRCLGSWAEPVPWLEASGLPDWDAMSDLDRGAALLHVWKRSREGGIYARENYPCRYLDDELLRSLDERVASRHAAVVAGSWDRVNDRVGSAEVARLYDLALDAERSR